MNKALPLLALATAAIITTVILSGCNDTQNTQAKSAPVHLDTFLTLHSQFCEKQFTSRDMLKNALEKDENFSAAKGFEGVFETHVNNISFAVSPEDDGCTTDVMVKNDSDSLPLFLFEDINQALLAKGYKETGKQTSRQDIGTDQSELTIIEKTYISPNGEITTLDFPLEKMDKYYMTLFAEKFKEAKQDVIDKSVNSLKMASVD